MNGHIVLILLIILVGCSPSQPLDSLGQITSGDSLAITTLGHQEQSMWEFFQSLETALKDDKSIQEEEIDEYIQALIDEGSIPKPEIFIETEKGTESRVVDYRTYRKYRAEHPINLERYYVFTFPAVDTTSRYSIRESLIKALKGDSLE